ncbi:hypothetical protein DNTS_031928 [Danionella cerebrum]|uniref:DUF4585 domain-containing protein n=1 Tax=Danionella cerebrum TaxID=2873325 RepID=A0A553Q742_9TELE|nr:hypothetical protein DNTS_031928 [Danionella translucida]
METLRAELQHAGPLKTSLKGAKEPTGSGENSETNYVDLGNQSEMKSDSTKTVKVTFTGEGNQLAIFKCKPDASNTGSKSPGSGDAEENAQKPHGERTPLIGDTAEEGTELKADNTNSFSDETEELEYTDMYLNSSCEQKDSRSATDVESHYITTHEIQLTELDHDVDYEFGRGSCWDFEDDNLVYSFVDYASFDSNEATLRRIQSKSKSKTLVPGCRGAKLCATGALLSTESELCESDKCASSDEGAGQLGNSAGHIHLSIKTSSRAINDPIAGDPGQRNLRFHPRRSGERGNYSFRSSDSKSETLFDRYFIPPPGRQHLASKLRVKDINEYSSGASSSVSELDDADKEVRNLTARSFRSLACPYFDAINMSSSSESSVSEHGLSFNKWSAFVDLNYGSLTREAHKNFTPVNKGAESANAKHLVKTSTPNPHTDIVSLKNSLNSQQTSKKIEMQNKPGETITQTETLNFSCNEGAGISARERRAKRALNAMMNSSSSAEVMGKAGCEEENLEESHKKAIFASSLLKNVISKKMQFEQERKMESIIYNRPRHPEQPVRPNDSKEILKGLVRQTSETSAHSQEETRDVEQPQATEIMQSPCEPETTSKRDPGEPRLTPTQQRTFKAWSDGEQGALCVDSKCEPEEGPLLDTSIRPVLESSESVEGESRMIKMSHLYVPSSQLMPKEKEADGISLHNVKVSRDLADSVGGGCRKLSSGQLQCSSDTVQTSPSLKAPEIKIRLRSVKENKSDQLNITNLLTPNISHRISPKNATSESKRQLLTISDKVPHFMVRDIRDNKCKFQTPIHQVRDVRKLVKSSYRFVALENECGSLQEESKSVNRGPEKKPLLAPMVIKYQSVNTNNSTKPPDPAYMVSDNVEEASRSSPNLSEWAAKSETMRSVPRVLSTKQPVTEQSVFSLKIDGKASKPKPEKAPESSEKKPDTKVSNQRALEKLQAAVKTMEQLYVFDRNEWKRKTQAPRPITDSHVLSLITREEQGVVTKEDFENECGKADTSSQQYCENLSAASGVDEDKLFKPAGSLSQEHRADSYGDLRISTNLQPPAPANTSADSSQQMFSCKNYALKPHKAPLSFQICPKGEEKHLRPDADNYLTIPIKAQASDSKRSHTFASTQSHPQLSHQPLQRSPIVMESWSPESPTASIYHHAMPFCLPAPTDAPAPHMFRKLLLDPATGQYYLVDTPVPMQPTTQRFYHPESGQYLDIPLPLTPVPVSPVAFSPAAYPPPYLLYPSTLVSPHQHPTPQSHSSTCSEGDDAIEIDSMYLVPPCTTVPTSTSKPVISITSQQGARIVAPPSFDGTTMSFVVEHR